MKQLLLFALLSTTLFLTPTVLFGQALRQEPVAADKAPLQLLFVDAFLNNNDTLWVECDGMKPDLGIPTLDRGGVFAKGPCTGLRLDFKQNPDSRSGSQGIIHLSRLSWVATDDCGNTDSVHITLALIDTVPPVIHGVPEDITVRINEIPRPSGRVYVTDECQCHCIILVEDIYSNPSDLHPQVILRTWTAIDQSGNRTTATQTITLNDEMSPGFLILQN